MYNPRVAKKPLIPVCRVFTS